MSLTGTATGSLGTGVAVYRQYKEREVSFMAASISYYAIVSLVPLLVVALIAALLVGGAALQDQILALAEQYLLPEGQQYVRTAIQGQLGGGTLGSLGLVSFLLTIWGALKVFFGVDIAFSRVYGSKQRGFVDKIRDGALVLVSVGVGVVGIVAVSALISVLRVPFLDLLSPILSLLLLAVAFFPLYYVFPDVEMPFREAIPGTVFAALGWTALGSLFGVYAQVSSGVAGALGSILLLLTWFYFAGTVLLVGAVFNAVLSGHVGGAAEPPEGGDEGSLPPGGESGGSPPTAGTADGTRPPGDEDRTSRTGDERRSTRSYSNAEENEKISAERTIDRREESAAGPKDRQLQHPGERRDRGTDMSEDREDETGGRAEVEPRGAPDISALEDRVEELRADLDAFESDVSERTVKKPELETELKRYVRERMRRGHARGWGPYLVLLYGTIMTLGAFVYLRGIYAIAAMLVLFLSTLGLYVMFLLVGIGLNVLEVPGQAVDAVRDRRG